VKKENEMAATSSNIGTCALPWRDIDHLAFATRDLEATIRFYTDVLGMHASDIAPANPIHGRTCTIKPISNASSELHFFEADAQAIQPDPEMLQRLMFPMVGVHHIAFSLPDAATGLRLQERLQAAGIDTTPVMDQGDVYNLLFHDNNDVLLEANWPKM
jgi:catechol 2,3-dioxygenase-like lactoylglutathione lyase family enzyme